MEHTSKNKKTFSSTKKNKKIILINIIKCDMMKRDRFLSYPDF